MGKDDILVIEANKGNAKVKDLFEAYIRKMEIEKQMRFLVAMANDYPDIWKQFSFENTELVNKLIRVLVEG